MPSTFPTRSFGLNRFGLNKGYSQLETPGAAAIQAAAALTVIRTRQPQLNLAQMRQALLQSADNLGNPALGAGRLNMARVTRGTPVAAQNAYGRPAYPTRQTVSYGSYAHAQPRRGY